jgi:Icc protein
VAAHPDATETLKKSGSPDEGRGFRLVQVTDCHLPASPDKPYRGLNSDSGLRAVIAAVTGWQPDAVLITGDLSEDASAASYQRLAAEVAKPDVPVWALPGNHDLPARMQQHFPIGPYAGPVVQRAGNWQVLLLDSSRPGRIDGSIDPQHLEHLQQRLEKGVPAVLALHHQPVAIGSPWIDKYRLAEPEALLAFVAAQAEIKAVVWGHVHQAFETVIGGARFIASPSTAANSLPGCERFTHDPAGPACRWLELLPDGRFETGILQAT